MPKRRTIELNSDEELTSTSESSELSYDSMEEEEVKASLKKQPAKKKTAGKGAAKKSTLTAAAKKKKAAAAAKKKKAAAAAAKKKKVAAAAKKKKATTKKGQGGKSASAASSSSSSSADTKTEDSGLRWWAGEDATERPPGHKWVHLSHRGVLFPPAYEPHGIPLLYDGKPVKLTPEQEEYATYFAQYLETQHMKKPQFPKNFFRDWKNTTLKGTPQGKVIRAMSKCDFRPIWEELQRRKEERQGRSKEEKLAEKTEREQLVEEYGYAMVDGVRERISNFRVEPPGLFLGRGDHPQSGKIKARIQPEEVTINVAAGVEVPAPEGSTWKEVIHNPEVMWLAMWRENIRGAFKYVWLSPSSRIKGESDMKKFEMARQLASQVVGIRRKNNALLKSGGKGSESEMQLATCLWLIDKLALRVGGEKGEDEADTVGCCSLRVEHIKLLADRQVNFHFLGKDSMEYNNTIEVPLQVYRNLKKLVAGKNPSDQLFDLITSSSLNQYLRKYMPGLSAKVFRTYNASATLEQLLSQVSFDEDVAVAERVLRFNEANKEVAILCNHQRSLPPTFNKQMERIDTDEAALKAKSKELANYIRALKADKADKAGPYKHWRRSQDDDGENPPIKRTILPRSLETAQRAQTRLKERIKLLGVKREEKKTLATVALTTSKINYIDPRIVVKWCNENQVPIAKVFSKNLREKFAWAIDSDLSSFSFVDSTKKNSNKRTAPKNSDAKQPKKKRKK